MLTINPPDSSFACYAFADREMVVHEDGSMLWFADLKILQQTLVDQSLPDASQEFDLIEEKESGVCVLSVPPKTELPAGYRYEVVRMHFHVSDEEEILRTSRAKALVGWLRNAHYCGHCGAKMKLHESLTAVTCPECGTFQFPRIEPCVITLVYRDGKILLARHVQRNQNIYACIAGFIEAGETVEHAVEREIFEETHLRVKNIRYFGSQSWPFPSQLMLGFTADYESGEIVVQEDELERAAWFDPLQCPASPPPGSIAYQLIEDAKRRASLK